MDDLRAQIIHKCLTLVSDPDGRTWLDEKLKSIQSGSSFHLAFGMVPKKLGKAEIDIQGGLVKLMSQINIDAEKTRWTIDELGRLALLLQLPRENRISTIGPLISTADVRELRLIFKALQYLEAADDFVPNMVDGIRTNVTDVYDAIALHNGFPQQYFTESAWNQMVLKGIFMERPIFQIQRLDERRNPDLARIAVDFAHERQSAGRKVTPELWRLVVPYVDKSVLSDLKKVISTDDQLEVEAGIKALSECPLEDAQKWLTEEKLAPSKRGWNAIGSALLELK